MYLIIVRNWVGTCTHANDSVLYTVSFPPSSQEVLPALKRVLRVAKQATVKQWILSFEHHNLRNMTRSPIKNFIHEADNIWKVKKSRTIIILSPFKVAEGKNGS